MKIIKYNFINKIIILFIYVLITNILFTNYIDNKYNYQIELLLETTPAQVILSDQIPKQAINIYGVPVLASQFPYIKGFISNFLSKIFGFTTLESIKFLYLLNIILAAYFAFLLAEFFFHNYFISFGLGLLYAFLPVTVFSIVFGHLGIFAFQAHLPLLIYVYIKILSSEKINFYSEISLGLLFGFASLNQPQQMIYSSFLFILIFVYYFLIANFRKYNLKKILAQNIIIGFVFLSSVIWWAYPSFVEYKNIQMPSPVVSIDASLVWNSNFWKLISFSVFALGNVFPLENYLITYFFFIFFFIIFIIYPLFQKDLHKKDHLIFILLISYFIYFSLSLGVQQQLFYHNVFYYLILLILFILIFIYFFNNNKSMTIYLSFILLFFLGMQPSIYSWVFGHIPLFNIFRTPNRFVFMVGFSAVFLFGYFFIKILEKFKKHGIYIYVLFVTLVLMYSFIGINTINQLGSSNLEDNYFINYNNAVNYIKNDKNDFRVIILPTWTQGGLDIYDKWYDYSPVGYMSGVNWMREFLIKNDIKLADTVTTNLMPKNNFAYWQNLDILTQQSNWDGLAQNLKYDWSIKYIVLLKKYLIEESYQQLRANNNFAVVYENDLFAVVLNKHWKNELITSDISVSLDKKFPQHGNEILNYKFITPDLIEINLKNNDSVSVFLAAPYFEGWYIRNTDGEQYQMYAINNNLMLARSIDNIKDNKIYIEFVGKGTYNFWYNYMHWYYPIVIILIVILYIRDSKFRDEKMIKM